jgi:mannose-6-phosphate isomerase-like protein (cupin superfamily)
MSDANAVTVSGPAGVEHWYDFREGGPVHKLLLPFPESSPAPFEIARWSIHPGTSNDLDVHRSREIWIIVSGTGTLTWSDQRTDLHAGDVVAFESKVPHQIQNNGLDSLLAVSVYWIQADH